MHPILSQRSHLAIYLAAWAPGSALLALLLTLSGDVSWSHSLALAIPLAVVYAFVCLASWYPCIAAPPTAEGFARLVVTHTLAGLFSSSLLLFFGLAWSGMLDRSEALHGIAEAFRQQAPLVFIVGILLYFLTVAVHYLLIAFESSQQAELAAALARQEQRVAERELELARSIQTRLLPPTQLEGEGYRLAARHRAAHYVAGDFYDIFRLGDGELGLVVADVAGKGVGASLIMATVKAMLPLIAAESGVVDTLRRLNDKLCRELEAREFVALLFARFDPKSGALELANSGLPDPYLLAAEGSFRALEVPGPRLPLGVRDRLAYESLRLELEPSDRLLLLTDGLPEATVGNGEPLGYARFESLLPAPGGDDPGDWLDVVLERFDAATVNEHQDDLTALVLERSPRAT